MMNALNDLKSEVHQRMCDNFDFPGVLKALLTYCKRFALYAQKFEKESKVVILQASKGFVQEILYCMGLDYQKLDNQSNNSDLIQCVVDLRNELRNFAEKEQDLTKKKEMFFVGDVYRDKLMNDFSVKIEDKTNLWKFFDKEE